MIYSLREDFYREHMRDARETESSESEMKNDKSRRAHASSLVPHPLRMTAPQERRLTSFRLISHAPSHVSCHPGAAVTEITTA